MNTREIRTSKSRVFRRISATSINVNGQSLLVTVKKYIIKAPLLRTGTIYYEQHTRLKASKDRIKKAIAFCSYSWDRACIGHKTRTNGVSNSHEFKVSSYRIVIVCNCKIVHRNATLRRKKHRSSNSKKFHKAIAFRFVPFRIIL